MLKFGWVESRNWWIDEWWIILFFSINEQTLWNNYANEKIGVLRNRYANFTLVHTIGEQLVIWRLYFLFFEGGCDVSLFGLGGFRISTMRIHSFLQVSNDRTRSDFPVAFLNHTYEILFTTFALNNFSRERNQFDEGCCNRHNVHKLWLRSNIPRLALWSKSVHPRIKSSPITVAICWAK